MTAQVIPFRHPTRRPRRYVVVVQSEKIAITVPMLRTLKACEEFALSDRCFPYSLNDRVTEALIRRGLIAHNPHADGWCMTPRGQAVLRGIENPKPPTAGAA